MATADSSVEAFKRLFDLSFQIFVPAALNAAVLLGIPDALAKAGTHASLSLDEIVASLPTKTPESPDKVGRILRVLVLNGVFNEAIVPSLTTQSGLESRFGHTELSRLLITDDNSFAPFVQLTMRSELVNLFQYLHSSVLSGNSPFFSHNGTHFFNYARANTEFNELFQRAMTGSSNATSCTIANNYEGFRDITSLVDVGGGKGDTLRRIVSTHPHIRGINFDLAHVVAIAHSTPGVKNVAGDMFVEIPKADAILLQRVIHNWNDEQCLLILKNCYRALPEGGKVIIYDYVLRPTNEPSIDARVGHAFNLAMLCYTGVGKERTKEEWSSLLPAAGFMNVKFLNLSGVDLVEAVK